MVVKSASIQTHIWDISILLSEKWVLNEIICTLFHSLYSEDTIKQNWLIFTDEDSAEFELVANAIKTTETYAKSSYMLCVFHALVKI